MGNEISKWWWVVLLAGACGKEAAPEQGDDDTGSSGIGSLSIGDGDDDGDGDGASTADGGSTSPGSGTQGGSVGSEDDDVGITGPSLNFDVAGAGGGDIPTGDECVGLTATIRDFSSSHPDFEVYSGTMAYVGLVLDQLGGDQTPEYNPNYAGEPMITSAATFADWYHDVAGTNQAFPIDLPLTERAGEFVFDSNAFFPLDGMGFGNEGNAHNFHFTTEVHTSFTYHGGELFTFRGDDDVWVFVNGQLALDLGGLHSALEATADMDTLGLTVGVTYPMDIFHAERHTNESNFRIVTTIDCFQPPEG